MRVLLLEDDEQMARLLAECLETWDNEVICAQDCDEAWRHIDQSDFDLVITDWRLPKGRGTDLVRRIRATSHHQTLPVLMISGYARSEDVLEAARAGANAFLPKPFSLEELQEEIDMVCRIPDFRARALARF